MGIISKQLMSDVTDRMAAQTRLLHDALLSARAEGGGFYYPRIHLGVGPGDFNIEDDLIRAANNIDIDLADCPVLALEFSEMINALVTHVTEAQGITNLDDYLTKSGVNVSEDFAEAYTCSRGQNLLATNVFRTNVVDPMASVTWLGSGSIIFTDGFVLGTGSGDFVSPGDNNQDLSSANSAAQNLQVIVASGVTADSQLNVQVTGEDGIQVGRTIQLTSGMTIGTTIIVGNGATDFFLDVNNVVAAGGANGMAIRVGSIVERVPQL